MLSSAELFLFSNQVGCLSTALQETKHFTWVLNLKGSFDAEVLCNITYYFA